MAACATVPSPEELAGAIYAPPEGAWIENHDPALRPGREFRRREGVSDFTVRATVARVEGGPSTPEALHELLTRNGWDVALVEIDGRRCSRHARYATGSVRFNSGPVRSTLDTETHGLHCLNPTTGETFMLDLVETARPGQFSGRAKGMADRMFARLTFRPAHTPD